MRTLPPPPNNGCDDCALLTEAFEETTLCAECQVEESRTGRHWEQSD